MNKTKTVKAKLLVPPESFLSAKVRAQSAIVRRLERDLAQRSENLFLRAGLIRLQRAINDFARHAAKELVDRLVPLVTDKHDPVEIRQIMEAETSRTFAEIREASARLTAEANKHKEQL